MNKQEAALVEVLNGRLEMEQFMCVRHSRLPIDLVWNRNTRNVICALRNIDNGKTLVVRYRQSSKYAPIMKKWRSGIYSKTITIASPNLGRYSSELANAERSINAAR